MTLALGWRLLGTPIKLSELKHKSLKVKPTIEGLSIVLLGSFNPQIFQPAWFAAQGLIRKEEGDTAQVQVIHPEVTIFGMEWAKLSVDHDRFGLESSTNQQFSPELLRDLTLGTFRLLSHTPVKMMGLNRLFHFAIESEEIWHSIGHMLAPKEIWTGLLEKPGTRSLSVQGIRTDHYKGQILVKVEPSALLQPGLFIHINDHFEARNPEPISSAGEMMDILEKNWSLFLERSQTIGYTLLKRLLT